MNIENFGVEIDTSSWLEEQFDGHFFGDDRPIRKAVFWLPKEPTTVTFAENQDD